MSDTNVAPVGGDAAPAEPQYTPNTPADPNTTYSSHYSAGKALAELRWNRQKEAEAAAKGAAPATGEQDTAKAETADPPQEAPGETDQPQAEPEAEKLPPIDPPRSWTKEEKERFSTLPRETQEYLATREQERDRAIRQSQNKAAEVEKQLSEKLSAAEQVRAQYESALPMLLQTLEAQQQGEFADVKTMQDVERLAREDWPRYVLWDAQQKKIAAVRQEVTSAQQRQHAERNQKWSTFAKEQDSILLEKAPELANPEVAQKVAKSAGQYLTKLGFTDAELAEMWNGESGLSLRDHRIQLLIRDGLRFQEAQSAAPTKLSKPVPQVQRPGSAPARGADQAEIVQSLQNKLASSGSLKDAVALLAAKRAAARR